MGPVVRLIGSGLGLASEALAARKASKAEKISRSTSPYPGPPEAEASSSSGEAVIAEVTDQNTADALVSKGYAVPVGEDFDDLPPNYEDVVDDEADWELDEAGQEQTGDGADEETSIPDVRKITQQFLTKYPAPKAGLAAPKPLTCPVIIPQRRPRSKGRGFVQAYAPLLGDCGIDQDTFMDFLKDFHKASQASPVFTVVLVAGHIAGYAPSIAAMAVSMSLQVSAGAAIVVQSRSRTNTFLDDVNEHFFRPRGLYAMLMSYKPNRHRWSSEPMDISRTLSKSVPDEDDSRSSKMKHNLQFSSGKSHTEEEMPESAPLIYPALDAAVEGESSTGIKGKWQKSSDFVGEYMDRRAQATYRAENPESSLNVPGERNFASRFSDPNHPVNRGSIVSLITGGNVDPRAQRQQRDDKRTERRGFQSPMGLLKQRPVKRALRTNVLYLLIVNYPSEEELATARADLAKEKKASQS